MRLSHANGRNHNLRIMPICLRPYSDYQKRANNSLAELGFSFCMVAVPLQRRERNHNPRFRTWESSAPWPQLIPVRVRITLGFSTSSGSGSIIRGKSITIGIELSVVCLGWTLLNMNRHVLINHRASFNWASLGWAQNVCNRYVIYHSRQTSRLLRQSFDSYCKLHGKWVHFPRKVLAPWLMRNFTQSWLKSN